MDEADAEPEEYEALFRAEYPGILRTAYAVVGDRRSAEEVTQEAFARLYVRWERVSRYDRPGAWVRRVAIRLAGRHRGTHRPTVERPDGPAPTSGLDRDEHLDLLAALSRLSPAQRAAVVLHYLHDLPVAQVAAELGCRESTARVHLHRARQHLAAVLAESEVTSGDR